MITAYIKEGRYSIADREEGAGYNVLIQSSC
jgi:hypothetical protein